MKLIRIAVCIAALFYVLPIYASSRSADAKVEFHVVDDQGSPVHDAKVEVIFDMLGLGKDTRISTNTDTNGICFATGQTAGILKIRVSKDGYYRTDDEIRLIAMGKKNDIKWGKWQPWGMEKTIILAKIRNPIAQSVAGWGWRTTKVYNKWIGFDILNYDYVYPYGKGQKVDFEIFFDWNGKLFPQYDGMTKLIRFPGKYSGAYWNEKINGSNIPGIYKADSNAVYRAEFKFFENAKKNRKGKIIGWEKKEFDNGKVLVGRSRCKVDEMGRLKDAVYFQIVNLEFACDEEGVALRCTAYYNPTPNDTNIEPK